MDGWDALGVTFTFGYEARQNLKVIVEELPADAWQPLNRPQPNRQGPPRAKPFNVKREVVRQREKHQAERTRILRMEFRTFLDQMIHIPCQIVRHARQTIFRLLNWTDLTPALLRLSVHLNL